MEKSLRIARACGIGSALCVVVSWVVAPELLPLGILAGASIGFMASYLAYDLGEVRRGVVAALRKERDAAMRAWRERVESTKDWLKEKHPFAYPAMFCFVLFSPTAPGMYMQELQKSNSVLSAAFMTILALWIIPLPLFVSYAACAYLGARQVERCYWQELPLATELREQYDAAGLKYLPATYWNIFRLTLLGFLWLILQVIVFVCGWAEVWFVLWFCRKMALLVKYIHRSERVLCGTHGMLGGIIGVWAFHHYSSLLPPISAHILALAFAGIIGAVLGVLSWELLTKRLFGHGVPA